MSEPYIGAACCFAARRLFACPPVRLRAHRPPKVPVVFINNPGYGPSSLPHYAGFYPGLLHTPPRVYVRESHEREQEQTTNQDSQHNQDVKSVSPE
ncbi:hypothetical protein F4777DRAFT_580123 [Nemania sp. FL0916]|nr:hypothetical protein F4777DRAFT_580123 [Nemania sp. FL0916]